MHTVHNAELNRERGDGKGVAPLSLSFGAVDTEPPHESVLGEAHEQLTRLRSKVPIQDCTVSRPSLCRNGPETSAPAPILEPDCNRISDDGGERNLEYTKTRSSSRSERSQVHTVGYPATRSRHCMRSQASE